MQPRPTRARSGIGAGLAILALAGWVPAAHGSVTIGQLASVAPMGDCGGPVDALQPTVTAGNSYVVPTTIAQGTITSWAIRSFPFTGQMLAMKVFRRVGAPATYQVVGRDGPRSLTPDAVSTFPASVPVRAGDVLGIHSPGNSACAFDAPGETVLARGGSLGDGASGDFVTDQDVRLNVTAVVTPSNTFSFGQPIRDKKKGTATVAVTVPNPGEVSVAGVGVKQFAARSAVAVVVPGTVNVTIRAQGKKKKKLKRKGKVKVNPAITYTPTSGDARTQSLTLKLRKKRKKR